MNRFVLNRVLAVVALSAVAALPAKAEYVDFEDALPTLFSGTSASSGGFTFASSGAGFSGIDSAGAFVFGVAPPNSSGQFLFGLNTDALTFSRTDGGSFRLLGFDTSFLPPVPALGDGLSAGLLRVVATAIGGGLITDNFDFGLSDANGAWGFSTVSNSAWASDLTSVSFSACVYDGSGGCSFTDPLAQFAIDNIQIPEPGSALLALAALGLLAATRRQTL